MPIDLDALALQVAAVYTTEKKKLAALVKAGTSSGEKKNATLVEKMALDLKKVVGRYTSEKSKAEAIELAQDFVANGAKAIFLTGAQRGGDFLNNQLRGRWAERVVASMDLASTVIVPFGPSGAAMPGEEDHQKTIMTFREIMLLEGKRPDLVAFDSVVWGKLPAPDREKARTWPERVLDAGDVAVVAQGKFGIEVKNSTWHYEKRRQAGGGPLSITVKTEEVEDIRAWEKKTGLPVLFFQVLFDEVYCMSFKRMRDGIKRGHVYEAGDYELDESTGADGKVFHRFHLDNLDHRCAKVKFPDESVAHVRVLPDGNVIPHIDFQPAKATDEDAAVVARELAY